MKIVLGFFPANMDFLDFVHLFFEGSKGLGESISVFTRLFHSRCTGEAKVRFSNFHLDSLPMIVAQFGGHQATFD